MMHAGFSFTTLTSCHMQICNLSKLIMGILHTFWNSPIGPKTTHFWGPLVNWSIPIAVCFSTLLMPEYYNAYKLQLFIIVMFH